MTTTPPRCPYCMNTLAHDGARVAPRYSCPMGPARSFDLWGSVDQLANDMANREEGNR